MGTVPFHLRHFLVSDRFGALDELLEFLQPKSPEAVRILLAIRRPGGRFTSIFRGFIII